MMSPPLLYYPLPDQAAARIDSHNMPLWCCAEIIATGLPTDAHSLRLSKQVLDAQRLHLAPADGFQVASHQAGCGASMLLHPTTAGPRKQHIACHVHSSKRLHRVAAVHQNGVISTHGLENGGFCHARVEHRPASQTPHPSGGNMSAYANITKKHGLQG